MSAFTDAYWTTVDAYARLLGVSSEEAERLLEEAASQLLEAERITNEQSTEEAG